MKYPKSVALFLTAAFVQLTASCYTTKRMPPERVAPAKQNIVRVLKKNGETLEFAKSNPAFIVGDHVQPGAGLTVKADGTTIEKKGDTYIVKTKKGMTYEATSYSRSGDNYVLTLTSMQTIPLSDVAMIWTRDFSGGLTALAVVGGVAVTLGVLALIIALTKESCPFLYARDSSGLTLEGELYSGAVFKGIERRDFLKLHSLAAGKDGYELKIANEADETQCTDELTLIAVDHESGAGVYAGADGLIHTVPAPVTPLTAVDFEGRDFTRVVAAADSDLWSSNPLDKDPGNPADLRSGLVLRFPKPAGARQAKLVVRIGNTYWADTVFGKTFGLLGPAMPLWRQKVDEDPDLRAKARRFFAERGVTLKAEVKTGDGWREAGFFQPTGPYGIEDDILVLPIADVAGDELTIKLQGGTFFWMIDYAAVDYSADKTVETHELAPYKAVDGTGRDIRISLLRADGDYYVMPRTGDLAVVKYSAPVPRPGWERSFFVRSTGYYTLHPKAGTADLAKFMAIWQNPDLFLKFSLEEVQKQVAAASKPEPAALKAPRQVN